MGSVYVVTDHLDEEKKKALKLIQTSAISEIEILSLSKRIRVLRKLNLQGVLTPLEQGTSPSGLFYTMDFSEQPNLTSIANQLTDSDITRILFELSGILASLHEQKLLHRRIHSNNLFIHRNYIHSAIQNESIVFLTDTGLSLQNSDDHFPIFSAPEILEGANPNRQTELYSFALLAYALYHRNLYELLSETNKLTPTTHTYQWLNQSIRSDVSNIIMRCLNVNPQLRPYDFREIEAIFYRNLITKPQKKPLPSSSAFVGRSNEFRFFNTKLKEVQQKKQWAFLIKGELETGKSRFMDEFAIEHQLRGKVSIRLEGTNIEPLLKIFPFSRSLVLTSPNLYSFVIENFKKIIDGKVLPTPIVICWHRFDEVGENGFLFFKQLFLLNQHLPILWLLETTHPIPQFDSLGRSDHFTHYSLSALDQQDVITFVGIYLQHAPGYQSLTRQLIQYFGTRPGWLIHALQVLISQKAIVYSYGKWRIHPLEIEKLIKSGELTPKVDLVTLTPLARTILQWMSVYKNPLKEEDIISIFGGSEEVLQKALHILLSSGYLIQVGNKYQFHYPVLKDSILKTLPNYRIKQIHGWIAQWIERNSNRSNQPNELLIVAQNYLEGGEINAFLRVFEVLLEKHWKNPTLHFSTDLLLKAINETKSPLTTVNQFKALRILYRQYDIENQYEKALEVCKIIQNKNEFKPFYQPYWLLNRIAKNEFALQNYHTARNYYEEAISLNTKKHLQELFFSYRGLIFCLQQVDSTVYSYHIFHQYKQILENQEDSELKNQEIIQYAVLLQSFHKRSEAQSILEKTLVQIPAKNIQLKIRYIRQLLNVYISNGDSKSFVDLLATYEKYFQNYATPFQQLVLLQQKIVNEIQNGNIKKVRSQIEETIQLSKIYYLPQNQVVMLFDWSQAYFFTGEFETSNRLLLQSLLIINRLQLLDLKLLALVKIARIREILNKNNEKLLYHIYKNLSGVKNRNYSSELIFELVSLRTSSLNNDLSNLIDSLDQETYYPNELIKLLYFRRRIASNFVYQYTYEDLEKFTNSYVLISEPFDQGLYLRELLQCSIEFNLPEMVKRIASLTLRHFENLNARWYLAECNQLTANFLIRIGQYSEGLIHTSQANFYFDSIGLPKPKFFSTSSNTISETDEMSKLNIPMLSLHRLVKQINQLEIPSVTLDFFLKESVLGSGANGGMVFIEESESIRISKHPQYTYGTISSDFQWFPVVSNCYTNCKIITLSKDSDNHNERASYKFAAIPLMNQSKAYGVLLLEFNTEVVANPWLEFYFQLLTELSSTIQILPQNQHEVIETHRVIQLDSYVLSNYDELIGQSNRMREVYRTLHLLKKKEYPVLIIGESGTGKEIVAKIIHRQSIRSNAPFYAINCAALPDTLIESNLFGHTKGAFTGADSASEGFFTKANLGTIFLDEINHMSLSMQGKLLRVIQEGEYYPVGSTHMKKTNVRIICAGKPILYEMLKSNQFREDLYFRINVVEIRLPVLSEKKEDIPFLIRHFIDKYSVENGIRIKGIRKNALQVLTDYDYPGNVRELENILRYAFLHLENGDYLGLQQLPKELASISQEDFSSNKLDGKVAEFEKKFILQVLQENNWNRSKASKILGLSRPTLNHKIKIYQLERVND